MKTVLQLEHVTVRYGERTALDDVSVAIGAGERVAVMGPNGAGKSTLLRAMLPDPRSWRGVPPCAWVPQETPEPPALTAWEYVLLGRTPQLSPWRRTTVRDRRVVVEAMAATQTDTLVTRRLETLSGGERRRLAVALALATEAPVLLLDEPTAHLDFCQREAFHALLARLDRTFVYVLHDLDWARSGFFTRVLVLSQGRLVADGMPVEVLAPEFLARFWPFPERTPSQSHELTSGAVLL